MSNKERKKRIYVTTINAYCGGTIALATLCKTIRELGYDARLVILPYFPNKQVSCAIYVLECLFGNLKYFFKYCIKRAFALITPKANFLKSFHSYANILKIPGIKTQWHPFIARSNSIVIYSEDVFGNPLKCHHIVRWLLYYYDYTNDRNAYSPNDLFIAYRDVFNSTKLNPNKYLLTITYFNENLYRQYNFAERSGNCYIIHKGKNRTDLPTNFDGPVFNSNMSQEELVDMLNSYKYCFCYDSQSFYTIVAVVCGCIPIVVMEEGKTEVDYLSESENHYGVAFGNTQEQIGYAVQTRELCLKKIDYAEQNRYYTDNFISLLEKKYGMLEKI